MTTCHPMLKFGFGFILIFFGDSVSLGSPGYITTISLLPQSPKSWSCRLTVEFKALLVMDGLCAHATLELIIVLD